MLLLSRCPICKGKLQVAKYECEDCRAIVSGTQDIDELDTLDEPLRTFMVEYILCAGSLQFVAHNLGITYNQAWKNYQELVEKLEYARR